MNENWSLHMALVGPHGERMVMAIDIDPHMAREISRIDPPQLAGGIALSGPSTFDGMVALLRRKEFRKELFIEQAGRLGALLAERMEDAEGWHDISRQEPAIRQLKGGK